MLKIEVAKDEVNFSMKGSADEIMEELAMGVDSVLDQISNVSDEPQDVLLATLAFAITEAKYNRVEV